MHKYVSNIQKLSDQYKIAGFIDEAHALQHRGTEQYKIFCMLRPCFHVLYAMTATPLMAVHNLKGMYNLIDYLAPKSIGSWTWFRNNLLKYHMEKIKVSGGREILQEVITGVSDMPTMKKIVDKFMIVRALKYDIQYHYHQVELSTEEWDMYKKAGKAALDGDDRAGNKKNHFASRLHDLQQVADWSHPLVPEEFRKRLSSKDKKMVELVRELTEQGLSTLIYTEYHATADRISAVIDKCVQLGFLKVSNVFRITGKESKKDRAKVEDALEPGSVVICTRAGTQSRNLQKANQVIVYNIPFSIGVLIQLIGRVARMDTKFTSQDVHIIEAKGTIDTYKRILVQDAAYIYNELFGENSNLPDIEQLDRDRLRELRNSLLWGFKTKKVKKG
jgi:SNF2 family DNA or RNA helicase